MMENSSKRNEKLETIHLQDSTDVDVVQQVHQDGTVDFVDTHALGGALEQMPKGYFYSWQFIGTVIATCLANNCAYLGWVLPANTLLLINEDIGPSPNLQWVATVWTLGSSVGFLLVGRLSDIFGRKWMVMASTGLGLIGCIVGCTATSINALIGANLCNGLGAAGQLSFGIVLGELVPNKQRGPIVTLVFLSAAPFAVFGPAIARAFFINTAAKWRWSYYLGVIFSGIALLMYQFCYHPPTYTQLHVQGKTKWQQMKELDYGGLLIYFAGMVLSIIGLSWGGGTYPWVSGKVLGTLITGILCLVALPFYEAYVVKEGALVPPRLFRSIGYVAITVAATIGAMVYYALTILWPTILGTIYTTNVMKIGWQSSVVGGGILLGQVFGGFGLSYIPYVKWQTVIMSVLSMAFVTSLVSLSEDKHAEFIVFGTLACIFIGYVDNITFPGVTLVIEPQDIGLATGVLGSIRGFGGAVAQALYVSVLTNKLADYLPAYVAPAVVQAGLPASSLPSLFAGLTTGNFTAVPDITPTIIGVAATQAKRAYIDSFHIVFYATIPFSALLILSACFVPNMDKYLGNNVAKRLQNFKNTDDSDVSEKHVETV